MAEISETVTEAEGARLLDIAPDTLTNFTTLVRPFAPVDGRLTVRQLLGLAVLASLGGIEAGDAAVIADAAARDANADTRRLLAVRWSRRGEPVAAWPEYVGGDVVAPMLVVPGDAMLADLTARVTVLAAVRSRLS